LPNVPKRGGLFVEIDFKVRLQQRQILFGIGNRPVLPALSKNGFRGLPGPFTLAVNSASCRGFTMSSIVGVGAQGVS
jgi:hypothetical protein